MKRLSSGAALVALVLVACNENPLRPEQTSRTTPRVPDGPEQTSTMELVSTIAFSSTRDNASVAPLLAAEIYLIDADGSNARRLTNNASGDAFASLSPDGKRIVFDSNRLRTEAEPLNTSDLFIMKADGSEQAFLARGSSATWSPDGKRLAFHRSASGTGLPIKPDPGAATFDSDIFVANVEDVLEHGAQPVDITNSADFIDDDADWSPDGQKITFTRHSVSDDQRNSVTAEIFVMNADGSSLTQLTFNTEEERGPAWSPDGSRILYSCRKSTGIVPPPPALADFELCVMNADGSGQVQLTDNALSDLTATFSPDGQKIVFAKTGATQNQLWTINADGTGEAQLSFPPGLNLLPHWGQLRFHVKEN